MRWLIFILLIFLYYEHLLSQSIIRLYDERGYPQKKYDQIIKDLKIFDILEMPDGKKFKILEKKTGGKTTEVLKVVPIGHRYDVPGDEYILRIPRERIWNDLYDFYRKGIGKLKQTYMNIPKFYHQDKYYMVAENIEHNFTAKTFLENPSSMSSDLWQEAALKFKEFALANKDIISIGDFKAQQLIYDLKNKKWRLVDWKEEPNFYQGKDVGEHLFTIEKLSPNKVSKQSIFIPSHEGKELLEEIDQEIKEDRLIKIINLKSASNIKRISEILNSPEDYKKLFISMNDIGNPTSKIALYQYVLKNSHHLFKSSQGIDDLEKVLDVIDKDLPGRKFKILIGKKYLSQVKDAKSFASVLKKIIGVNNDQLSDYMDSIWKEQEEHFFSLNPSKSEMEDVLRIMNNPQYKRRYLNLALSRQLIDQKAYDELGEMMNVPEKVANKGDTAPSLRNRDAVLSTIEEINRDLQEEDKQGKSLIGKIKNCLQGIFQGKVIQK